MIYLKRSHTKAKNVRKKMLVLISLNIREMHIKTSKIPCHTAGEEAQWVAPYAQHEGVLILSTKIKS